MKPCWLRKENYKAETTQERIYRKQVYPQEWGGSSGSGCCSGNAKEAGSSCVAKWKRREEGRAHRVVCPHIYHTYMHTCARAHTYAHVHTHTRVRTHIYTHGGLLTFTLGDAANPNVLTRTHTVG